MRTLVSIALHLGGITTSAVACAIFVTAEQFNAAGIAVFALDMFGPRGVQSTAEDQSQVPFRRMWPIRSPR